MTTVKRSRRNRFGRCAAFVVAAAASVWLVFGLFEPMLVWSSGWKPLPQLDASAERSAGPAVLDGAWASAGPQASAWLSAARTNLEAPALSAAVSIGGHPVWAQAVGFADVESGRLVSTESQFRLGSSSKVLTALAIGTLLDAGRVDLDVAIGSYVSDLGQPVAAITTRQALSHMGGVRNYGLCWCFPVWEHLNRRPFSSVREGIRVFETDPLISVPGESFAYSSFGFNLAGAVVEAVSTRPFLEALDLAVLAPMGAQHTGGDLAEEEVPNRVSFYETDNGEYKRAFAVDNSIRYPSGGLLSTPLDMVGLGSALLSDQLLTANTRALLVTPQALADGSANPQGYALGWRVGSRKLLDGRLETTAYSHHGTAVGSTSYLAVLPELELVVSVMMNKGQENLDILAPEATRLLEIFAAAFQSASALGESHPATP